MRPVASPSQRFRATRETPASKMATHEAAAETSTSRERPYDEDEERSAKQQMPSVQRELTVVTWNVLSHIHTRWSFSLNGQSSRAEGEGLETEEQRTARHRAVVRRLAELQPDIVLLQEVDEYFMPLDWDGTGMLPCDASIEGYAPFRSSTETHGEGTAVLLRSATVQRDPDIEPVRLAASAENDGKTGIIVHVRPLGTSETLAVASVHLPHGMPQQQAAMLTAAVAARAERTAAVDCPAASGGVVDSRVLAPNVPMVLGGDFNATPAELAENSIDGALLGAGLTRVAADAPTSYNERTVDHLYVSGVRQHGAPRVGALPPLPLGPWTKGGGHDGSDHAWVCARVSLVASPPGTSGASASSTI